MKASNTFLVVLFLSISLVSAQQLEVDDLVNASFSGSFSTPYGNNGAIHFYSNGEWVGTYEVYQGVSNFYKGEPFTGNLTIEIAEVPGISQSLTEGTLTLTANSSSGEYQLDIRLPTESVSSSLELYPDFYGSTYYDQALTSVAKAWRDDECNIDSDADDSSDNTIDKCVVEHGAKVKKNIIPNLYGKVTDMGTGVPLFGIEVSFLPVSTFNVDSLYDKSQVQRDYGYNISNGAKDYEQVVPKAIPDVVTDSNGFYSAFVPEESHIIFKGSKEDEYNAIPKNIVSNITIPVINGQSSNINVTVTVQSASAGLKSDAWVVSPTVNEFATKSQIGAKYSFIANAGEQVKLVAEVDARPWKLPVDALFDGNYKKTGTIQVYNHTSYGKYAQIDQLDYDTYRVHFEDLPEKYSGIDWDFNDIVVLVDMDTIPPSSPVQFNNTNFDCDNDTIKDWLDQDDYWCDVGQVDTEVNEVIPVTNFNAEGHIISSRANKGNKYICSDPVHFTMFGVNNGGTNENITYLIENKDGTTMFAGNNQITSQTLFTPAGQKTNKTFEFFIPCSFAEDRYEIFIVWHGEKWHKIGNFFVIPDTTLPNVKTIPLISPSEVIKYEQYVNQSKEISFVLEVPPQPLAPGTVYIMSFEWIDEGVLPNCTYASDGDSVTLSAPSADILMGGVTTTNSISLNVTNAYNRGCVATANLTYHESKHYNGSITLKKQTGLVSEPRLINASVWATEQQARDIYYYLVNTVPVYAPSWPLPDVYKIQIPIISSTLDWFDTSWGFEYRSSEDGIDVDTLPININSCQLDPVWNASAVTGCERDASNVDWKISKAGLNILVLDPMTVDEIEDKVLEFIAALDGNVSP